MRATGNVVRWGFVFAALSALVPVFAIVALVLGAMAVSRDRVAQGVAIMAGGVLLAAVSFTIGYQHLTTTGNDRADGPVVDGWELCAEEAERVGADPYGYCGDR